MKTPVLESLFNKVVGLKACNFIKGRLQHRCFPVNNAKFLRTHFFTKHLQWLLLYLVWATIATAYFLCNVVSAIFGQHCQKQPFADVLKNTCFEKCLRFYFKTSVVEFLFNTVAALKAHNFIKKKLRHRCFPLNLGPSRPRQNCVGYFPSKSLLRALGQHFTSKFLVHCSVRHIWITLTR